MSTLILLFESAVGYSLFEIKEWEEIKTNSDDFLKSANEFKVLQQSVKLIANHQFKTAKEALVNIQSISSNEVSNDLNEFLTSNLPKKKSKFTLGLMERELAKQVKDALGVEVVTGDLITSITRVIRSFIHKFLKVESGDVIRAQLGLAHQYSRMKCMFDVNREDKPIIQSIALVDQLDKNINSFCMRIKEWFGWHFPELSKITPDNATFTKVVSLVENKEKILEEYNDDNSDLKKKLIDIVIEPEIADRIYEAARASMGSELNQIDADNIRNFCEKVVGLVNFREGLGGYLRDKMKMLAPNTTTLVGETLGARLISHSGSLSNLAKYPASTIQILGAEKALFRALKARSNKTPKYGLLFYSNYIGKAAPKDKGKISRYLANKIAQSSRLDFFSSNRGNDYGEEFKKQVEERMNFLLTGNKPRKNVEVMKEAGDRIKNKTNKKSKKNNDSDDEEEEKPKKSKKKPSKVESSDESSEVQAKKKKKTKA